MAAQQIKLSGRVQDKEQKSVDQVVVTLSKDSRNTITDTKGYFEFNDLDTGSYTLLVRSVNYKPFQLQFELKRDTVLQITVIERTVQLAEVEVMAEEGPFGIRKLRGIENGGLYEGKKTEVVAVDQILANKSTNNSRQIFNRIPSLNIWESDAAGLQLEIGGRGLSPKRTSNFNVRQNGYDISADPLGYPESYYTPPSQAVKQIEVIRGAGALQYGSQFGGLVNFRMKEGKPKQPFQFRSENSLGSFDFFNSFNSFSGSIKDLNYYSYLQYKRGNGFRNNSSFEQYGAFANLNYQPRERLKISFDYTFMYYLSQQAGGLTDEQFNEDPEFSNRSRNYFKVNWNLMALRLEYQINDQLTLYNRAFGLVANRSSLGLLETPNLEDPLSNRDLIEGNFHNLGNETRLLWQYEGFKDLQNSVLLGVRLYRGQTNFRQGFGSAADDADFSRVDTAFLDRQTSDYDFPNMNVAVFLEQIIRLSPSVSLIPGFRYEHILTEADGYFTTSVRTNSFGDFIVEENPTRNSQSRNILLFGLGTSIKLNEKLELYANATSNYRAINFTDIQIQTNTQVVDPNIDDESGYSFDLGLRKMEFRSLYFEGGFFYIVYENRIGEVIDDGLRLRTNIGAAEIYGFELYAELELISLFKENSEHRLSVFYNGSINRGEYTDINDRALVGVREGNRLEDLPNYNVKTGLTYANKRFTASLQGTFVGLQFSDAANTITPFNGVFGPVPSYQVFDFTTSYLFRPAVRFEFSINNFLDESYFTRRALAYPGPGIIPAQPRVFNFNLIFQL
jgi:Fe(3+) dicitrate transport protein